MAYLRIPSFNVFLQSLDTQAYQSSPTQPGFWKSMLVNTQTGAVVEEESNKYTSANIPFPPYSHRTVAGPPTPHHAPCMVSFALDRGVCLFGGCLQMRQHNDLRAGAERNVVHATCMCLIGLKNLGDRSKELEQCAQFRRGE